MKKTDRKPTENQPKGGAAMMQTQEQIRRGILEKLNRANTYVPIKPSPERLEALQKGLAAVKRVRKKKE